MPWPHSQDYNEAIQTPASSFADPELQNGLPVTNPLIGMPAPRSGNFADVYEFVGASGAKWAVKCFTREIPGLQERYSEISKHLMHTDLPFMVDFKYLEKGIRIRGQWYPVLKMRWIEGSLLNEFVRNNLDKPAMLKSLGELWPRMAKRLREANIAHADLQHGNVLLVPGSKATFLAVKLIDYDGMWVPSLANKKPGELGHRAYQHPHRFKQGTYNGEVDRLPLLAIACALRCLVVGGKSLWDRYDNGDNVLFSEADLQNPAGSALFKELWNINDAAVHDFVGHLVIGLQGALDYVPLLQGVMDGNEIRPLSVEQEKHISGILGPGAIIHRPPPRAIPIAAVATVRTAAPSLSAASVSPDWQPLDTKRPTTASPEKSQRKYIRFAIIGVAAWLSFLLAVVVCGSLIRVVKDLTEKDPEPHIVQADRTQDTAKENKDTKVKQNNDKNDKPAKRSVADLAKMKADYEKQKDAKEREKIVFAMAEICRSVTEADANLSLDKVFIGAMKDADPLLCRTAAFALGCLENRTDEMREALEKALLRDDAELRQNAVRALGRYGEVALPTLRKALRDSHSLVKREAVSELMQFTTDPTKIRGMLNDLLPLCRDTNSEVRRAALNVLVRIVDSRDKEVITFLRPALDDGDLENKRNAAFALSNIGGDETAVALPILLDAIKTGDPELRRKAVLAIRNIGPSASAAVPELIRILQTDTDAKTREHAPLALGGIGKASELAVTTLVKKIQDASEERAIRIECAVALQRIGPLPTAIVMVPDLLGVLADPKHDAKVRERIMWSLRVHAENLRNMKGPLETYTKILTEPLNADNRMLVYDCAYMLGMVWGDKAPEATLDVLKEYLHDGTIQIYAQTSTNVGGSANVVEQGQGDGRIMVVDALQHMGPTRYAQRQDIMKQLRVLADDNKLYAPLRTKSAALLKAGQKTASTVATPIRLENYKAWTGELALFRYKGKKHVLFEFQMEAGKTYQIDMKSPKFDAYLFLEAPSGPLLKQNGGLPNAKIVHKATINDKHRIVATHHGAVDDGQFTITVKELNAGVGSGATGSWVKTTSGLKYLDLKVGDGKQAKLGDIVTVHFTATLKDGTKVESTFDKGKAEVFTLGNGRPEGCNEGIMGMREGGKRKLIIPFGFGAVPSNVELHFEIELRRVDS